MLGKMMYQPLLISQLIDHADRYHGATEIVSVETAGGTTLTNWSEVAMNARKLASALSALGLKLGARCGTIAWNMRHLEIYFGDKVIFVGELLPGGGDREGGQSETS